MTRELSTAVRDDFTASEVNPVVFTEFNFDSGDIRFWTGIGEITWDSVTWTGSGDLLTIAPFEETAELVAKGLQFELSGVPASLIGLAVTEDYQGRSVSVYFGTIDVQLNVTTDPYLLFSGYMDIMSFQDEGENAKISLSVENRLIALERPNQNVYTPETQHLNYPADKGFDFVTDLQEKEIIWGN